MVRRSRGWRVAASHLFGLAGAGQAWSAVNITMGEEVAVELIPRSRGWKFTPRL